MPPTMSETKPVHEPATLANWLSTPFNRSAFQHVPEIVPCVRIENDSANTWQLAEEPNPLEQFGVKPGNGPTLTLQQLLRATETNGFVVLHNDRIVHEYYANGMTRHTPHALMSVTKSVVGLVAGILHGRGVLDAEALISTLVPEIAGTAYGGASVRDLLDMRAGVTFNEEQLRAYENAVGWQSVSEGAGRTDLHSFFEQTAASSLGHGGSFRYVSPNTDLLGWAIERAAGQPFPELVTELLWKPMGAEDPGYFAVDRKGASQCTRGLCATTRDLARIGQLVLQGGRRGSSQIVPASWIDDIATKGDREAWRTGEFGEAFAPISTDMDYRSGWYINENRPQTLFAMGIYGQNLFVDRANRLVIAKVSAHQSPLDYQAVALTHMAVPEIRRCLTSGS